jgi:hypothetical protein
MTRKDLKNNILNHRMNFLINYYIQENNNKIKKYKLIEYYMRTYKDNYLNNTIKNHQIEPYEIIDEIEKRDDDIEDHYKYMFINPPPKPEIDYDELDKQYELKLELEAAEKEREKEIMIENDINDDYDDDDYDLTYTEDENDDYDIIDEY